MKGILVKIGIGALIGILAAVSAQPGLAQEKAKEADKAAEEPDEVAILDTTMGTIVLEFFPDVAPNHVKNFKKLARDKFYDGTTFHRVIPGFMIQGGCPNSKDNDPANDGTGGPGWKVKAEFNSRPHVRGTLSMARTADPDSAGSQFFICVKRAQHLDGQYTNFGRAIAGMDVVDRIVKVARDARDRPLENVTVRSVKIVPRAEWDKMKKEEEAKEKEKESAPSESKPKEEGAKG